MEDEEHTRVGNRRRSRGSDATARLEALQRLKALRSGGRRSDSSGYQIKLENPIYDTVEEDEYDKLVAKRREEVKDFIVGDDGFLGYVDDGEEEDWSKAGPHYSSDDEPDGERVKKKKAEKKDSAPKKPAPSSLSAAAALMGKQRLSSMFTSNVFKKSGGRDDKLKGLSCDSIVDDVIAEFAPDEADREQRRRAHGGGKSLTPVGNDIKIEKESVGINSRPENENGNYESLLHSGEAYNENVESGLSKGDIKIEEPRAVAKSEEPYVESMDCAVEERIVDDKKLNLSEVEVKPTVKKEEARTLNAKIVEVDPSLSATAGWKAVISGGDGNAGGVGSEVKPEMTGDGKSDFELDDDGSLPFYILDAYEEIFGANRGNVYLFGKVRAGNMYHSCCIVVKNMQRCVYAIPRGSMFDTYEVMKLEKDLEESQISPTDFRAKLQDLASGIKTEVAKHLVDHRVSTFSVTPVKRKYAFERSDIPAGDNYVLKINYPFKDPPLPSDLKGETFAALLGTNSSALELLLVKRKIKGPSWLLISNFNSCHASLRVSWCKFEVTVDSPKDIKPASSSKHKVDIPPVIVTAIKLKTIINKKQGVHEIISASIICCQRTKIDIPMLASEWKRPGMLSHFTVVRKPEGGIFPMGFTKEVTDKNMKAGSNVIGIESSERALLNRLMIELHKLDSDIIVGHNISGSDLDILLHRAQACRVPSSMWSKIGRLKRSSMPKLNKGSGNFASGASAGIMSCIAGRLLCDTFLCSHDLLKEVSYSLTQLAKSQLNKDRKEIAPEDIPKMFHSSKSLMELIEFGETDAWLAMELMFHLSILPLTRQLTNISGNLWGKTMQGARAQRVEYLLLHNFHAKKYMVPDKRSSFSRDDEEPQNNEQVKGKKGPSYSGGLVLEPKRGLYDKYILLLDFNSLYPSIIQEYNICFTTVERSPDGTVPHLPSTQTTGLLPELLRDLVGRRRLVKSWMKKATGLKVQQFDIQQQALKLTANSMYGCLGFSKSRFYAKPLAELITQQGREILQSTVDLVQNNLSLEVIYGDTDSIMIHSGLDDITKAKVIAEKVIQEVNKKYRCLEIDLDGLYKRMLLLQKKKYAAVKLQFKDGKPYEVIERKGLDMVRRDWSIIAKELGDFCLSQILSGGSCEDIVESIHSTLLKVQEDVRNGQVELEKYIITKTLTKPPEAYPDAKNQPHVQVALRLKKNGYSTGCNAGDAVPYIICCEQGVDVHAMGFSLRARHPDELKKDEGKWLIDIDYYLSEQIHRVVSRLCASIQGTSPERLADCLGLDSSKFQSKSIEAVTQDSSGSLFFAIDDEERYRDCKPLILSCPSCHSTFNCPVICSSVCMFIAEKSSTGQGDEDYNFWHRLHCPKCPREGGARLTPVMIANQVKRQVDGLISMYYKGLMMCDDETCKYVTRSLNLRVVGDSERGTVCPEYPRCSGHLVRQFSEADLYKQLTYFCHVLDTLQCLEKVDSKIRAPVEKELTKIRPMVDLASSTVHRIRDRCAYGWVRMNDLIVV